MLNILLTIYTEVYCVAVHVAYAQESLIQLTETCRTLYLKSAETAMSAHCKCAVGSCKEKEATGHSCQMNAGRVDFLSNCSLPKQFVT